jgi:genome maintenance exonuclease 1
MKQKQFTHISRNTDNIVCEQINEESGRYYKTPEGKLFPSVTTVVGDAGKEGIKAWRKRVGEEEANKISNKATSRGTRVHTICENYLNNEPIDSVVTLFDLDAFKQIKKVLNEHVDNVHMQETRLYSNYLEVAGTVDCVAEYDGVLSVIDFKTSTKLKNPDWILGYRCQATAYAIMYEELFNISVPQTVIIIAVDDEPEAQVFIQKRNHYVVPLLQMRKAYKEKYNI